MSGTHRLVQLLEGESGRLVCHVDEPSLRVLDGFETVYELAQAALAAGQPLARFATAPVGPRRLSYDEVEHHHFKHPLHRRPGDVHVHFFGADAFSFSAGVKLRDGDFMKVSFDGWGRALRNPVAVESGPEELVRVAPL